ncbi:dihydrolipoamide dehydrogenase [Novosphingobium barchaimii LL02]|uniref:Dihydrolipoamide dehydrogenase n=1 Tax=Novosphingobium barchaimii LL02 TaxID=1114963 RepID=A0A0J8ANP3_9SPHN|nr:dihydrolipoyl dehydrogenase [Novosphingobium barchaimii]KMS56120.1 dihydrolipoamide dehydrogenase [Novosphingobium barchaimii LL02]
MTTKICDVAIIGAGTAGLAAELSARRHGASTLLIDESFSGTTCTNVGCMPSKLLIAAAAAAHGARHARTFGIAAEPVVDGVAVLKRLRLERDRFIAGVDKSIGRIPDGVKWKGRARFTGLTTLEIDDGTVVEAKAVVIAVGAAPSIPAFLDPVQAAVLTNETLFDLETLPISVAVIGAGPLGLELAQALSRLGVETRVFDQGDRLASLDDKEVSGQLAHILGNEFPIHLEVQLSARLDAGKALLSWTGRSEGSASFDYVLAASGRPPRLKDLGLESTGLVLDEHGAPKADPCSLQCGAAPIFLAGDAANGRPVLHEAQAEGAIAGHNAARYPDVLPGKRMVPLSIMFTDPAMAVVGDISRRSATILGAASFEDQGRAKVFATNHGLAHILADPLDGKLIGAVIAAPAAEHTAHLLAWSIQHGMTASQMLALPYYHPTYEEGLKPAFRAICKAVGSSMPMERDDGFLAGA